MLCSPPVARPHVTAMHTVSGGVDICEASRGSVVGRARSAARTVLGRAQQDCGARRGCAVLRRAVSE